MSTSNGRRTRTCFREVARMRTPVAFSHRVRLQGLAGAQRHTLLARSPQLIHLPVRGRCNGCGRGHGHGKPGEQHGEADHQDAHGKRLQGWMSCVGSGGGSDIRRRTGPDLQGSGASPWTSDARVKGKAAHRFTEGHGRGLQRGGTGIASLARRAHRKLFTSRQQPVHIGIQPLTLPTFPGPGVFCMINPRSGRAMHPRGNVANW